MKEAKREANRLTNIKQKEKEKAKKAGKPGMFNPDRHPDWLFPSNSIQALYANHQ